MSVQAMTRVMEQSEATGITRLVLLVIANHETEERGAFPSIDRIAHEARCDVRTVQRCILRAVRLHELVVDKNAGPHGTNIYRTSPGQQAQIAGVANRRGGNEGPESPPELKEQSSGSGSALGSRSSGSQALDLKAAARPLNPITEDQLYLAKRITQADGTHLTPPTIQKLNSRFGTPAVTGALRRLHGFPPPDPIGSVYAYVESLCQMEAIG